MFVKNKISPHFADSRLILRVSERVNVPDELLNEFDTLLFVGVFQEGIFFAVFNTSKAAHSCVK